MKIAKFIVAAFFLYLSGVATGMVGTRILIARRSLPAIAGPAVPLEWIKKAAHSANLPDAKQARVDGLVKEAQRHLRKLWEPVTPVAKAEVQMVYQTTMNELSPEEQTRFKSSLMEYGKHRPGLSNWLGRLSNADPGRTMPAR